MVRETTPPGPGHGTSVTPPPCRHRYRHLRQTTRLSEVNDQLVEKVVEDVFYCEICLEYRRVGASREAARFRERVYWSGDRWLRVVDTDER